MIWSSTIKGSNGSQLRWISVVAVSNQLNMMKSKSKAVFFAVGLISILVAGCGTGSPFESVPVSGKVTYEDGSPAPVGKIFFKCLEPPIDGMHPRVASVPVQSDGTFDNVTTYKFGDGLVVGKHKVSLSGDPKLIPKEYTTSTNTPLEIDVTASGQYLELKVPRPIR
jgi:hypothetical protein